MLVKAMGLIRSPEVWPSELVAYLAWRLDAPEQLTHVQMGAEPTLESLSMLVS